MGLKLKLLLIPLIILIVIPAFVSAQPPVQTIVSDADFGIIIDFPKIDFIKQSQSHSFNFHLFNKSDGAPLTDPSIISCYYHLFNQSGEHSINTEPIPFDDTGLDWEIKVEGENFSVKGLYSFLIGCNTSAISGLGEGGGDSFAFIVNGSGEALTIENSIVYIIILLASFFFFTLSIFGAVHISWTNPRDGENKVISVNRFKYFRIVLFGLAYLFLTYITSILNSLTASYLLLDGPASFMNIIYLFLLTALWPVMAATFIFWVFLFIYDQDLQNKLKRGLAIR